MMTRKEKVIAQGIALMLGSIWVGSYFLHFAVNDAWWEFPTFVTMGLMALGGYLWTAHGFIDVKD